MKIASFTMTNFDKPLYGVVKGEQIIAPNLDFLNKYSTLRDAIEADVLDELDAMVADKITGYNLANVTLLPPVPNARRVICVGMNYPKIYPVEGAVSPPQNMLLFAKLEGTLVGHNTRLEIPMGKAAETFDYEGEIVLVIGKSGRYIKPDDVPGYIAGYTIMNDGSVRGWQTQSLHAGKNFANSGSCGPWMVTSDEVENFDEMQIQTRLNGETMQSAKAKDMLVNINDLVSYISHTIDIKPGDLIATGSPDGSGGSLTPPRFLKRDDELEIEVSGIGILKNTVGLSSCAEINQNNI
jgi:2-keto-4-pentenoate hydratase/2-oxohepta-3-ene-1,7-dioic acid hydratase in catechol pathway